MASLQTSLRLVQETRTNLDEDLVKARISFEKHGRHLVEDFVKACTRNTGTTVDTVKSRGHKLG
jgi:hypothetical protein